MNPILLQKQLKENAADLDEFYKDLKNWGEDMKRKEESERKSTINNDQISNNENKKRKHTSTEKKINSKNIDLDEKVKPKTGLTDYSAWEKFDVEAECEKIDYDENEESDLTDECDEALRDQAYVEKEKGNKFVKNGQWKEAIQCYTKAIDCYSYDSVFYANRALCFIKIENMTKAESDCNMSLKLDKTYVKAYQRRAAAREALNKLEEAEMDLLKVLELEPKNVESRKSLEKIRKRLKETKKVTETVQRPISKFSASRQQKRNILSTVQQTSKSNAIINKSEDNTQQRKEIDSSKSSTYWPSGEDDIIFVKTVNKPAHLQSKKPLKRIEIVENIDEGHKTENKPRATKMDELCHTLKTDDLKVLERNDPSIHKLKESKNQTNSSKVTEEPVELFAPKSSVQFYSQWKRLKTLENKYNYVKLIDPEKLPQIFKDSMESAVFSDILEILVKCFINNGGKVYGYLSFLTTIRRFSTLIMFMTDTDKNYVRKLIDHVSAHEDLSKEEVDQLIKLYEL